MGNMEMDSTLVVPGAGRGWGHSGVAKQGEVKNPNLLRQPLSTSSVLQGNRAKKRPDGRCAGSFPPRCPQAGRWAKDSCSHSTPRLGLTSVTLYFIYLSQQPPVAWLQHPPYIISFNPLDSSEGGWGRFPVLLSSDEGAEAQGEFQPAHQYTARMTWQG